jgi:hypothetical protein
MRRHTNLVRENSAIQRLGLRDLVTDRAVRIDPVHRATAGVVVGDQREAACMINRHVDRARPQRDRGTVRLELAARGIDSRRTQIMLVAFGAEECGPAIA